MSSAKSLFSTTEKIVLLAVGVLLVLTVVQPILINYAFADTASLAPTAVGNFDEWDVNTGTKVDAVAADDGDTTYIAETTNNERQTFGVSGAGVPAGATVDSVTLEAVARKAGTGESKIKLRVEKGTAGADASDDENHSLTMTYTSYTRVMATNPFSGSAWTVSEVNTWVNAGDSQAIKFGVSKETGVEEARVTKIFVTVTYTVPEMGTITIVKEADPEGEQEFGFERSFGGDFTLTDDGISDNSVTFEDVEAGEHTVMELIPDGWMLTDIDCDDGDSTGDTGEATATIQLADDEHVTCTFTNTQNGHLIVDKTTDPESETEFSITASGTGTVIGGGAGIVTDAADKDYEVTPGTYSVAEDTPDGWAETENTCVNIVVGPGETKTCTITNTQGGVIIVQKVTAPEGDEEIFDFSGDVEGSIADGDSLELSVVPGEYSATEAEEDGWDLTDVTCEENGEENSSGSVGTRTATFNVEAGETVICTFTNEKRASITVTKYADPENGPFTFTLISDLLEEALEAIYEDGIFAGGDENSYSWTNLLPGFYGLFETVPEGWEGSQSASCEGWGEDAPESIGLEPGEHVFCVFNNTEFGTIGGVKFEDLDGDGEKDDGETNISGWTITLDYLYGESEPEDEFPMSADTDEDGTYLFGGLIPGVYQVCEEPQEGWEQTFPNEYGEEEYAECESGWGYEVSISAGENSLDNDFGNFKDATVSGTKYEDLNGNGTRDEGEAGLAEWHIFAAKGEETEDMWTDGDGNYSFAFGPDEAGEWVISEELPESGWVQREPVDPNTYTVEISSGTEEEGLDFGNQRDENAPEVSLTTSATTT